MPRRVAALFLALAGCGHTAPFPPGDYGSDQPFAPGSPRRITLNLGDDRAPVWLPDESGLLYSFQRLDRADRDRCLGVLPPDGGRLEQTICVRRPAADDSTDVLSDPAVDGGGRLLYTATSSGPTDVAPRASALLLATLADPATARALVTLPYIGADGTFREGVSHVAWLGDSLVYVAEHIAYRAPCKGCPLDTLRTGVEIVRLDVASGVAEVLPGTGDASSVAPGGTPDVIYYTLGGDSRVVRRVLSAGTTSMVHDFGAAGIARDVQVAGSRLVAVVGGTVAFAYDSLLGYDVQRDGGGFLYMVDLGTGAETVLPGAGGAGSAFRHPALSPSGKRVVAELVSGGARGGGTADLWEFDLP